MTDFNQLRSINTLSVSSLNNPTERLLIITIRDCNIEQKKELYATHNKPTLNIKVQVSQKEQKIQILIKIKVK